MQIEKKNFQSQDIKVDCTMILSNHLINENKPKRIPGKLALDTQSASCLPFLRERWLCPFALQESNSVGAE